MKEKEVQEIKKVIELLSEVEEKRGPYNRDTLTHAGNVIDNASEKAKQSINILTGLIKHRYPICGKKLEAVYKQEWNRTGNIVAWVCPDVKKHFPQKGKRVEK